MLCCFYSAEPKPFTIGVKLVNNSEIQVTVEDSCSEILSYEADIDGNRSTTFSSDGKVFQPNMTVEIPNCVDIVVTFIRMLAGVPYGVSNTVDEAIFGEFISLSCIE